MKDTSVDNIPILKGTGLKIELLPNHYSEEYFDNPHKFSDGEIEMRMRAIPLEGLVLEPEHA